MNKAASTSAVTYFDNAATTWPKPQRVVDAMLQFQLHEAGSPNRAGHCLAARAGQVVTDVRSRLATLVNEPDARRVIHCFNASDALNMGIKGALSPGDHAITTDADHNSVQRPLQALADQGVIELTRVSVSQAGFVDPDDIRRAIRSHTRLIATLHASNVIGTIQPIAEIGRIAREHDVLLLVDAAQSIGILPVDMQAMCIDLLAFPGHKALLGPTGTGALVVGERARLTTWREGGTGGTSMEPTQPEGLPTWLEAGTPNTIGLAGLNAALQGLQPAEALQHDRSLLIELLNALQNDRAIEVFGDPDPARRVGVVSFRVRGVAPAEVAKFLDHCFGIAVRPGIHCAPYLHRTLGTAPEGTVRVSLGWANNVRQVCVLTSALGQLISGTRGRPISRRPTGAKLHSAALEDVAAPARPFLCEQADGAPCTTAQDWGGAA